MRYIFLIYTREGDGRGESVRARQYAVMDAASSRGVLVGAQPLQETATATTVRMADGKPLITDGPFAETKEQLAGYYIIDCKDLDEAIEWAKQIPTTCQGGAGCIEIRPLQELPPR
ncbi:MAG TPA: YciI family protein [Steroidobacteraceae bacterium]|jgi:hypothetical protein